MKKSIYLLIIILYSGISGLFAQEQGSGKFSGVIFGEYYFTSKRDATPVPSAISVNGKEGDHGFSLKRIDLVYDYKFNEKFNTRIRFDADDAALTTTGKITTWVKDAWLQWNYNPKHSAILGIQIPPGYELAEALWGNRFIGIPIEDLRKYISSRDVGLSFKGSFGEGDKIRYHFMYANNATGTPETDKYKRGYGCIEIVPTPEFFISIYGDVADNAEKVLAGKNYKNKSMTGKFMVGYKKAGVFNGAITTFVNKKQNGEPTSTGFRDRNGFGLSAFGTFWLNAKMSLVGRYDIFNPDREDGVKGYKTNLFTFAYTYKPMEKLTISPNILIETYESNGVRTPKNTVIPRFSFNWTF
jgi:hypothetical protein